MEVSTTQLIDSLLLPPGGPILLAFIGLVFWRLGLGRRLFVFALVLLWISSLPATEKLLFAGLETYPALDEQTLNNLEADAIVLLGARRYLNAPEYAGDTAGPPMLVRLRYAARLARRLDLPVIPSGGITGNIGQAEAQIYAKILRDEYGVRVEHIEPRSHNTWENARYTAQLMKKLGLEKIILVTDAAHMPRAIYSFEVNGIDPIPAPTWFLSLSEQKLAFSHFLPNGAAMANIAYALHEYLGTLKYRLQ
ncbi:MAG: YdcF family protein [Pseudomonadota bacterium]